MEWSRTVVRGLSLSKRLVSASCLLVICASMSLPHSNAWAESSQWSGSGCRKPNAPSKAELRCCSANMAGQLGTLKKYTAFGRDCSGELKIAATAGSCDVRSSKNGRNLITGGFYLECAPAPIQAQSPAAKESFIPVQSAKTGETALPLLCSSPPPAPSAQPKASPPLPPGAVEAIDASIVVSGKTKPGAKSVIISVRHLDSKTNVYEDYFVQPVNGSFSKRIHLYSGRGNYEITVMDSTAGASPGSEKVFTPLQKFQVTNRSDKDWRFLAPSDGIESDDPKIIALAQKLTQGITDPQQKSKAIYRWVTQNIAYDHVAFKTGAYAQKTYTASGTLKDGLAVCQGVAFLSAALHRAAGLRAKIIVGPAVLPGEKFDDNSPSQLHAWNEVEIDGKWQIQDPTWDLKEFALDGKWLYFNADRKEFSASHRQTIEERF